MKRLVAGVTIVAQMIALPAGVLGQARPQGVEIAHRPPTSAPPGGRRLSRFPAGSDQVRLTASAEASGATAPPVPSDAPPSRAKESSEGQGGKRSKKWYWIGAGVLAGGIGVYLATQGGGKSATPSLQPLPGPPGRP